MQQFEIRFCRIFASIPPCARNNPAKKRSASTPDWKWKCLLTRAGREPFLFFPVLKQDFVGRIEWSADLGRRTT